MLNISIRMAAIKDGGIKMSLQGKKVLVVGTGKSGIAATELLCANGIDTVLFDGNKELDSKTLYEKAPKLKEVPLILGDLTDEQIDEFDVAVLSPGVPTDIPMVNALRDRGVKIWGEIELAYTFGAGEIIAITGTNWKDLDKNMTIQKYNSISDKEHLKKILSMPVHFLLESGKGFFVKKDGAAIGLREELRPLIDNPVMVCQMKDVIDYRAMDYYQRRYRQSQEEGEL